MIRLRSSFAVSAARLAVAFVLLASPAVFAAPNPPLKPPAAPGVAKEDGDAQKRPLDDLQRLKAKFNLDFDKQDINEVVRYIAQWTGKDFIMGDNIRGKITILCPTPVSADEAFNAFVAALKTNNLQITPTGKFFKIEGMKDSIRTPIPICTTEHCPFALNEEIITKVFHTKYNEAESLKAVLTQFISREGELDTFAPDLLILSDTVINVQRIETILKQVDQPLSTDEINVVQLLHAPAQEISATLTQIFSQQSAGGAGAAAGGRKPIMNSKDSNPNAPVVVTKILPDERSNRLIIIAQAKAFERVRELINKLDVATDAGQVHVYYLENADAEELSSTLSQIASGAASSKNKSKTGSTAATPGATPASTGAAGAAGAQSGALFTGDVKVSADKATNALLIVASPHDYRNMLKVIDKLDIRRRQVFIEAVIMEVKLNDSNTLNIDLHSGYALQNVSVPGAQNGIAPILIGSEESGAASSLSIANLASLTGFLAGIQGPPITVNGLNITLPAFGVILNALQTNSDVNVISTPCLLTSDNGEAEISVGQTVPFRAAVPTGMGGLAGLAGLAGAGSTTSTSSLGLGGLGGFGGLMGGFAPITRVPVELRLKIKPHINESDYVKLEIDEQVENIASVDQTLGPTTAKRAVKTTIFAKDQTSVVIGGLIQEQTTHSETRTPILGELPVIGALFRADLITRDKTNLLLFLTPYIIRDQADFRAIFERKMRERQEFVARYFGAEDQYQVKVDYEHKHGPLSVLLKGLKEEFARVENGGTGAPGEVLYPGSAKTDLKNNNAPTNVMPVNEKAPEPDRARRNDPEPELPPSSLGPLPTSEVPAPTSEIPPPLPTPSGEAAPTPAPEAPPVPVEAPPPPPPAPQ